MAKTPFFFYSGEGNAMFLARRIQAEGHKVGLFITDAGAQDVGRGLVPYASTPPRGAVVVFDFVGHGAMGRFFRSRGHPVIGGNLFDRIERDRPFGASVMAAHGIAVPPTVPFTSLTAAQRYLGSHEGHWFFKASGNHSTALTANAPTSESMIRHLEWARHHLSEVSAFELQKKITGTEVSCEGWFDGTRFVPPFTGTFEDKQFLTGNLGPRTGCEANLVWAFEDALAHLPRRTVACLADTLAREGYVGPLDLNMIVDATGEPKGLEWTARLGFDATQAQTLLLGDHLGEQLESFARGELDRFSLPEKRIALTLRVTVPPYPNEHGGALKRVKGIPLDPAILGDDTITPEDVMLERGNPVLAGFSGWVCTVGATGRSIASLRQDVLGMAKALDLRAAQYRIDPVERAEKDWATLNTFGYLGNRMLQKSMTDTPEPDMPPGPLATALLVASPIPEPPMTPAMPGPGPGPEGNRDSDGEPFLLSVDRPHERRVG